MRFILDMLNSLRNWKFEEEYYRIDIPKLRDDTCDCGLPFPDEELFCEFCGAISIYRQDLLRFQKAAAE